MNEEEPCEAVADLIRHLIDRPQLLPSVSDADLRFPLFAGEFSQSRCLLDKCLIDPVHFEAGGQEIVRGIILDHEVHKLLLLLRLNVKGISPFLEGLSD